MHYPFYLVKTPVIMDKRTSKQAITIQRSRFEGNGYSPRCTTILDTGYLDVFSINLKSARIGIERSRKHYKRLTLRIITH